MNLLRHAVSKQKRRFIDRDSGLDLDLTYITPSLIAMGYPSRSLEAFYRNPMSDVEKFLDSRHEAAYKVYNLCSERSYSDQRFHGRVAQFPFPDHSPPPFQLIHPFCEDVSDWLHTKPGNVVAVHCKAGKGRTGVMICAFLVHCGATADDAIKLYGEKRTHDGCGVTIPSQLRYIRYYEQFLESRTLNYDPRLLTLQEIVIDSIPKPLQSLEPGSNSTDIHDAGVEAKVRPDLFVSDLILTIMSSDVKIYESMPQHCYVDTKLQQIRISITDKIVLAGDVKMMLWYDSLYKRSHLCHFCFNTTFIGSNEDALYLKKQEVDKACKDKLHSIFDKDFAIRVNFLPAFAQQSPLPTLDSLPNRAILLKYKNHEGPNSVQISPPYFSTRQLAPARNKSAMEAFDLGGKGTESRAKPFNGSHPFGENGGGGCSPPNSAGPSSPPMPLMNGKALRSPVVVHTSKPAFKPMWSDRDRDRDRDDNWDTASISSDCSESDSSLEWWYTKPPRFAVFSGTGTGTGSGPPTAVAVSASPPSESGVGLDQERRAQNVGERLAETRSELASSPMSMTSSSTSSGGPGSGHVPYRPVALSICNGGGGSGGSLAGASGMSGTVVTSPPSSAYRSPPHSATSPLAREIKFETETIHHVSAAVTDALKCADAGVDSSSSYEEEEQDKDAFSRRDGMMECKGEDAEIKRGSYLRRHFLEGLYLNEEGKAIMKVKEKEEEEEEEKDKEEDGDDGRDSGVESVGSRDPQDCERAAGWVDSVSRWLWAADGKRVPEPSR
ncbi:hypothetical protein BGZ70_002417 [Mortierella alpina]|uniref:Phosphatidylinositol 3,4,5-trisphosphate 3-phosphatase and dual-specificity protein phosphatase PTEN n=1 Tax=Mortierella alpina TaxID=64518 RepID=A0A9P6JBA1_MORAP|nr:hypothetical protein BGZ70_002417 [Mortierella alpina]